VFYGFADSEPDLETILDIHRSKTARYSISLPIVLGYLLNTQKFDQKVFNQIIKTGEDLGIAFQMKDDELGIWGEQKSTGKGVLKDVSKNKKTAIRLLLNTSVSKKEKLFLAKVFGNDNLKEEDKKELFDLLTKYNIKDNHSKILNLYNQKAKKNIKKLPKLYQEIFIFIEEFNTKRIK
jgi:geranylgeranyl diphosphate synthase type I